MGRFFGILLLIVAGFSCAKERNLVPDYPVNFSTPLTDPRLSSLNATNGYAYVANYGVAGLLLYRRFDGAYVAYDRCSTVNPEQKNAVVVDEGAITASDPKSGAKFLLNDGSPQKAPAETSLKQYQVIISGNTLRVVN